MPPHDSDRTTDDLTLPPSEPAAPSAAAGPPRVAGFEILEELGRGGMGVVYKARQAGLNRVVALKMILAGSHASAADRARFLAEAEAIAAVRHEGIVQVFEFGSHEGQPYFALEFCDGGSLAEKLGGAPVAGPAAAALVAVLARAVEAAHAAGVVHRDLKPANVLLSSDTTYTSHTSYVGAKITDFGLAKRDGGSGQTRTGAILGTPSYMAPEQASGEKDVGPPADIYALGAILYEALTGRPPFRAATALDTVLQVISDEPVPPRQLNAKVPRDLETIALKCLQKDPARRYASAAALAEDLDRFVLSEPIRARPASLAERLAKRARRHPGATATLALAAAAVVFFVANQSVQNARLRARTQLAQDRLEQAVAAVERVMTRAGSPSWALRPELQADRREMLEEAIAFFDGLGAESSQEPQVRRQAARANLLTAAACLTLGEYDRADKAAQAARDLYCGLAEQFPGDAALARGEGEALALLGHAQVILARFEDSLTSYQKALVAAERAVALAPDDEDSQHQLADAHQSLGYYYSFRDPQRSNRHHEQAKKAGEALLARASPSYRARLAVASALVHLAPSVAARNPAEAAASLSRAGELLRALEPLPPPSGRAAEIFWLTQSAHAAARGQMLLRAGKTAEGLAALQAGLAPMAKLVKLQPKGFTGRVQGLQYRVRYASALQSAGRLDDAAKAFAEADRLQADLLRDQPQLVWLKHLGAIQRSLLLVTRLRKGYFPEFATEAERLLASAAESGDGGTTYNVACAYAVASAAAPASERERLAARAVAALRQTLAKSTYFRAASSVGQLSEDADLKALRGRADFAEFVKTARAGLPAK